MKLSRTHLGEFSKRQIHSNKKILGNGYFILANFRILLIHGSLAQLLWVFCFLEVLMFFCLIVPPPGKVAPVVPTLARQVEISPQPYASHTVFSHNQTNEKSALLAKNMKQIDPQDGRSLAVEFHHFAYSFL